MSVERDVTFEEQLEAGIQRETRSLRQRLADVSAERDELRRLLGLHDRLSKAVLSSPSWIVKPGKSAAHAGIVVAQLTDTHFDEVVDPVQVAT